MPPKVLVKNKDHPSGVLPVNAAQRASATKTAAPKLKLEIRRLPPSLTLVEFEAALGDEWKLAHGKVDWREFVAGKLKAPGKQHVQARCSLHMTSEAHVQELSQHFNSIAFLDKAGTHKIPELKNLQPQLQYAANQKTPISVKQRDDNRQGTIDQDPDFMRFLEEQTMPTPKPSVIEPTSEKSEVVEIKSTPLIDDLREKKANKAKAATAKAEKKKDDEEKKATSHKKNSSKDASQQERSAQQNKVEQAAKEAAKVLNKQAASKAAAQHASASGKYSSPAKSKKAAQSIREQNSMAAQSVDTKSPSSPAPNRGPPGQRPRGNAEGIKKMLQKDLGIRPKPAVVSPQATTMKSNPSRQLQESNTTPTSSAMSPVPTPAQPPIQPSKQSSKSHQNQPKGMPSTTISSQQRSVTANPSTPKAYLKHANPSQGMTEMLIQTALAAYGPVINVTIDPRKGTAIAVFKDAEGLKKAMEAKTIPVAGGAVEVHQFRETRGGSGVSRGGGGKRGARGGGAGGGQANSAANPVPKTS
ncbi:hypothetical protein M433DRAFT_157656 [Acidomyces richmondensis BFW]|nr:MAG: hypothetical protein FE78DRAFT_84189 [Acidomyces sp. 'richmondensis']KYG42639.1 hypothetical protein M433DRAFT_157656 [Acidomyces richmondensis BFW]